jgi:L-gulono-1,4-lactone dehydrogenase
VRASWANWAGTASASPSRTECPATTADLQAAVRRAARDGLHVRVAGSGHSFTPLVPTDGVLLLPDRHTGLVDVDRAACRVTVRAGTPLRVLNRMLAEHGLAFPALGDIDAQTIGGAVSTGTHGTGRRHAALSAQVSGVTLVTATGDVLRADRATEPAVFSAARLGLGALGVLDTVTLDLVPAFLLAASETPVALPDVLDDLDDLVAAHDHVEFYWHPHTRRALLKVDDRTDGPAEPLGRVRRWVDDELLANRVFDLACRTARRVPAATPAIAQVAARALSARTYTTASADVFVSPRRVRFRETEYAVPREAIGEVMRELEEEVERGGWRVSFPVEVRVAPADDVWLSTAYGRDTAYLAAHAYVGTPLDGYLRAVEDIALAHGGRPHWGKLHSLGVEELRARVPRLDDFLAVRDRLDPGGRFANDHLDRVLGLAPGR